MVENTPSAEDRRFSELVGRIFSDEQFAQSLERDPEQALRQAGVQLNDQQLQAIRAGGAHTLTAPTDANVAAFVRPVVSVLTKGTRPVVSVVVSSAVVARTEGSTTERR